MLTDSTLRFASLTCIDPHELAAVIAEEEQITLAWLGELERSPRVHDRALARRLRATY